jgi:hypothetical protein
MFMLSSQVAVAHALGSAALWKESLFGRAEYHSRQMQRGGSADPHGPIARAQIADSSKVELPAASLVVLPGKL